MSQGPVDGIEGHRTVIHDRVLSAWRRPAISSVAPRSGGRRRALPADPAGRFLLHKCLFVHYDEPADKRIQTEEFLATCMRHWSTLVLLHRWLTDNVQTA
jgi:hypothetical protein